MRTVSAHWSRGGQEKQQPEQPPLQVRGAGGAHAHCAQGRSFHTLSRTMEPPGDAGITSFNSHGINKTKRKLPQKLRCAVGLKEQFWRRVTMARARAHCGADKVKIRLNCECLTVQRLGDGRKRAAAAAPQFDSPQSEVQNRDGSFCESAPPSHPHPPSSHPSLLSSKRACGAARQVDVLIVCKAAHQKQSFRTHKCPLTSALVRCAHREFKGQFFLACISDPPVLSLLLCSYLVPQIYQLHYSHPALESRGTREGGGFRDGFQ